MSAADRRHVRAASPPRDALADVAAEVELELAHHLECLRAEARAAGRSEDEAERAARARFGDLAAIRAACLQTRSPSAPMFDRIHRLVTVALAVALVVLLVVQHTAEARARQQLAQLHDELAHLEERLSPIAAVDRRVGTEAVVAGVGDTVVIEDLFGGVSGRYTVDLAGAILLPAGDAGRIPVAGLTAAEIERQVEERMRAYFLDVDVQVALHGRGLTALDADVGSD